MERERRDELSPADELRKVLTETTLSSLLQGGIGAFSLRQLFINEYINYIGLLAANPHHIQEQANALNEYDPKRLISTIRAIFSGYSSGKCQENEHKDVLILSRKRTIKVKTAKGEISGDYIFFSIADELKENHSGIRFELKQLNDQYFEYDHIRPAELLKAVAFALGKKIQWNFHKRAILFKILAEGGCRVASCAESFFSIRPLIRMALIAYEFNAIFSLICPKLILSNDDCFYTKPINNINMKVLVLQSAGMVEVLEECRSLIFEDESLLPDYYLSSGTFFADIKSRHHIARKVETTGLPRYDVLSNINKIYSRTDFLKRFGINDTNRVLLWTTQSHGLSNDESINNLIAIFSALKHLKQVSLIIKQHPEESDFHTQMIRDHAKKYNVEIKLMDKNSDIYEQLCACDLLITRHSTTAIEAIALDKPVIILNLSGQPDPVDYVSCGVAAGVYEGYNLENAIKKLLQDDSELTKNRKEYVKRRLYKIDGQATRRVVDLIIQMMDTESDEHDN